MEAIISLRTFILQQYKNKNKNKNKNLNLKDFFELVRELVRDKETKSSLYFEATDNSYEVIDQFLSDNNFDKLILAFIINIIFRGDTLLKDIFDYDNNLNPHNDYDKRIDGIIFDSFYWCKKAFIVDLITLHDFYLIQKAKKESINIKSTLDHEYYSNKSEYPFQCPGFINKLRKNNELDTCFNYFRDGVNPYTYTQLYPAMISLWFNSLKSTKLQDKIEMFDENFFLINDINIPFNKRTERDLFLMSLLLPNTNGLSNNVTSWQARIEKKIFNTCKSAKRLKYRSNYDNTSKLLMSEEDFIFDPNLKHNSSKAIPNDFKYDCPDFWGLISETYHSDNKYKRKFDNQINLENIKFFTELTQLNNRILINKDSYKPNKGMSLFYINQVTKWADLLFISNGLLLETSIIDGFATKSFICQLTNSLEFSYIPQVRPFDSLKHRDLLDIFDDLIYVSRTYNDVFHTVYSLLFDQKKTYDKEIKSIFGTDLYNSIFDDLLSDSTMNKIESSHIFNLAYYEYLYRHK